MTGIEAREVDRRTGDGLVAKGLSKRYGHVEALSQVDLTVRRGTVTAVFGDNGAGKSTLFKILAGVVCPDTGSVVIDGKSVVTGSIQSARGAGLEIVYQDLALAPDLCVYENMFLGREVLERRLWGLVRTLEKKTMRSRAAEALAAIGIQLPSVGTQVRQLSGGQQQAVAVARALLWGNAVLLLDEPTGALGHTQAETVVRLIKEAANRGLAIAIISHDIPRTLSAADSVVVLRRGSVALRAPAEAVTLTDIVGAMVGTQT
jgi:simple sugar transport system ATP-binding protein